MIRHSFLLIIVVLISVIIAAALVTACSGDEASPLPTEALEPITAPTTAVEPTFTTAPVELPTEVSAPPAAPTDIPTATTAPTEPPPPTPTEEPPIPTPAEQSSGGGSSDSVNIDAIFPPGTGKDLSLMGCTGCHNFVPLVIVQFTPEEWDRNAVDHRDRCSAMTDENYEILYTYLTENFGPDDPVPELPQVLLDQWTSY